MRFWRPIAWPKLGRDSVAAGSIESDLPGYKSLPHDGHAIIKTHSGTVWLRYWIHFLAIIATGGAAALNFLNVYLMDSDDPNAIAKLGAFQFVAKLHEAMMLGSLSLAMIDFVRNCLLSPNGIPLGYILSPVMYNNIDWLLSASFWTNRPTTRQLLSNALRPRSCLPPSIVIVLAILFANIAGPMSAIAIVPRLGWSSNSAAALFPAFWNASTTDFWPEQMVGESLPAKCMQGGAVGSGGCPAYGSKAVAILWSPRTGSGVLCTTEGFQSSCNASMSSTTAANAILRSLTVDFSLNNLDAYASTPNAAIYHTLGLRFQGGVAHPFNVSGASVIEAGKTELVEINFAEPSGIFKPVVATSCKELQYDQTLALYQDKNITTNWTTPTVTWLDDAPGLNTESFLFSYRVNSTYFDDPSECEGTDCYAALVCSISARWSPHGLWYNTAQSSLLFQDHPQPSELFRNPQVGDKAVVLRKDWLELTSVFQDTDLAANIVSLLNEWNTPHVRAPQSVQGRLQENIGPTNHSVAISIILAATITEAMANGPIDVGDSLYNGDCNDTKPGFEFSSAICAQDPSFWVHTTKLPDSIAESYSMVTFSVRRAGWGWFWQDSLALQISLGTLLLHGLLTLVYLLYTLLFTRTLTTRWASATELLILAIDSFRAPSLAESSIRPRDRRIWLEPVTIREVEGGDRVSMIVGDGKSYPERVGGLPVLGKKYM